MTLSMERGEEKAAVRLYLQGPVVEEHHQSVVGLHPLQKQRGGWRLVLAEDVSTLNEQQENPF